jgi:hypothetical protein
MKKVIFICRLLAAVWLGNDCGPIAVTKPPAFAESVIGIGALPLRANISETLPVVVINEQGEEEKN